MNKFSLGIFAALASLQSMSAFADTIWLRPIIQESTQACFNTPFNGFVSRFDEQEFRVHVVLTGCGNDRRPPVACNPFVVPKDRDVPAALKTYRSDPGTIVMLYRVREPDIVKLTFDGNIGHPCPLRDLDPKPQRRIPYVQVYPEQNIATEVFNSDDARSLGIQGQFVGGNWHIPPATDIKPGTEISVDLAAFKAAGQRTEAAVGSKIALAGSVRTRPYRGYYLFDGEVTAVGKSRYTMKINKIVLATDVSRVVTPIPPLRLSNPGAVRLEARVEAGPTLPWLGQLRGRTDPVELELRKIRDDGDKRVVETRVGVRLPSAENELIQLMRGFQFSK